MRNILYVCARMHNQLFALFESIIFAAEMLELATDVNKILDHIPAKTNVMKTIILITVPTVYIYDVPIKSKSVGNFHFISFCSFSIKILKNSKLLVSVLQNQPNTEM